MRFDIFLLIQQKATKRSFIIILFFRRFFFRGEVMLELFAASEAVFGSSASEEHKDLEAEPEGSM